MWKWERLYRLLLLVFWKFFLCVCFSDSTVQWSRCLNKGTLHVWNWESNSRRVCINSCSVVSVKLVSRHFLNNWYWHKQSRSKSYPHWTLNWLVFQCCSEFFCSSRKSSSYSFILTISVINNIPILLSRVSRRVWLLDTFYSKTRTIVLQIFQ